MNIHSSLDRQNEPYMVVFFENYILVLGSIRIYTGFKHFGSRILGIQIGNNTNICIYGQFHMWLTDTLQIFTSLFLIWSCNSLKLFIWLIRYKLELKIALIHLTPVNPILWYLKKNSVTNGHQKGHSFWCLRFLVT